MIFLLSALIGATLIISSSTLFRPLQRFYSPLFKCSQCVGMWVGMVAGGSGVVSLEHGRILDAFIVGAATSFLSTLADGILTNLLGESEP